MTCLLCYGPHFGHEGLREGIVAGTKLRKDDVLLTIGAAGALFIIATSLLEKGDELIVVRPNYATNIETPRAIGAGIRLIDLRFEEKFALDIDKIKAAITSATRYISVTYPHNPTGVCLNAGELKQLVDLAEEKACICWSMRPTGIWYSENSFRWRQHIAARYQRLLPFQNLWAAGAQGRLDHLPGPAAHDRHSWRRKNRSISAVPCWTKRSPIATGSRRTIIFPASGRISGKNSTSVKAWMRQQERLRMDRARRRLCLLSPAAAAGRSGYRPLLSYPAGRNTVPMWDRAIGSRCRGIICASGLAGHRGNRYWRVSPPLRWRGGTR